MIVENRPGGNTVIGTEYVGSDVDELPVDAVLASTHGLPGQVHEVISAWAAKVTRIGPVMTFG